MTIQNNRVLSGPIISTFFYYVIPSLFGLLALTTANLVDGVFVGNYIGGQALAAVSLLLPYITFLVAISLMLAIGGVVSAGKYLGEGKKQSASAVFSKILMVAVSVNVFLAILSYAAQPILYLILNVPVHIKPLVNEYFEVIRWVLILQFSSMVLYYFVRIDGHPILGTWALIAGAIVNILLDGLFIYYLQMGLAGAAYATGIAQVVQCLVLLTFFLSRRRTLQFSFKQSEWISVVRIAYNGLSEFVNEISIGIVFLVLNWLLIARLGTDGVAAFSVVNYVIFLSVMVYYGVADALHLLVSQNFGAKNNARMKSFFYTALCSVTLIGGILVLMLIFAQSLLITAFLNDEDTQIAELVGHIMMLVWPIFLVNGVNILICSYFTATHKAMLSACISACRSIIMPVVMLLILYVVLYYSALFDTSPSNFLFLIALPAAEWLALFLSLAYIYRHRKTIFME